MYTNSRIVKERERERASAKQEPQFLHPLREQYLGSVGKKKRKISVTNSMEMVAAVTNPLENSFGLDARAQGGFFGDGASPGLESLGVLPPGCNSLDVTILWTSKK